MATSFSNPGQQTMRSGASVGSEQAHTYRLKFRDEGERPAKDIEFQASDAHEALIIAHQEARRRPAELWRDGRKLCTIRRREGSSDGSFWEIGSANPPSDIF